MKNNALIGHLAAAGAYVIFGVNIIVCKDIANSALITPFALFTMRALGATILFWLVSLFLPKEKVALSDMPKLFVASVLGLFLPQLTFLKAITMITSLDSGILMSLSPVMTMLVTAVAIKEPITFKKASGVVISFCGVVLLVLNTISVSSGAAATKPMGVVLMLLNALSFASYLGIFKPIISRYSVVTFMKWMFLFSLLISLPFSAKSLLHTDYASIDLRMGLELAFLIVFTTFIAYFLIPVGQKRIRPTLVSMYSYLQPIIAAVFSIWLGMDVLTWKKTIAAILIIGGVVLVNRSRARSE